MHCDVKKLYVKMFYNYCRQLFNPWPGMHFGVANRGVDKLYNYKHI